MFSTIAIQIRIRIINAIVRKKLKKNRFAPARPATRGHKQFHGEKPQERKRGALALSHTPTHPLEKQDWPCQIGPNKLRLAQFLSSEPGQTLWSNGGNTLFQLGCNLRP